MGQRELILMLLASVITALAIFAGIKIFQNQAVEFDENQFEQIMLEIAEEAQAAYIKPKALGGLGYDYTGINFDMVGCPLSVSGGTACKDSNTPPTHVLLIHEVDKHHITIRTVYQPKNHVYMNTIHVKADTAIFLEDWTKLR